ncbi:VOC family protein, partial [Kocuria subflava]|nr:catechol 1,2-dioxygenase [Kocuria subflava]
MEKLLAHLSHLEITCPDVEASATFYIEKFGMREVHRADDR